MTAAPVDAALARLRGHWAGYWPGADLDAVAADVRARLAGAVRAWGLEDVAPLAGGHVALVAAAERRGDPVVVKVQPRGGPDADGLLAEAVALAHWQATGVVVPLLDLRDGGATLLLDRLTPGTSLDDGHPPPCDRLDVLGGLAARLHAAGPPPPGSAGPGAEALAWRRSLAGQPELVLLDELVATSADEVLVHGDLHGGNALDHTGSWRVVDPKGWRVDRHLDVWALMDPAVPELPADGTRAAELAAARLERYAAAAGLDPGRARSWVVVRARAEALAVDAGGMARRPDAAWAARLHRLADALAG